MSAGPDAIDVEALGRYLESAIEGFSGLRRMVKFGSGQSNPTYLLEADSGRLVLRAKPPGPLLKSAHQVDREDRAMRALAGTPVPVPKCFHLCDEAASPIGRMFFVMEHLDGRIFWDPALPEIASAGERAAIFEAMNEALAGLHDIDPSAVGLADFGRPGGYFARQLARWSRQYEASALDVIPAMDRLMLWLHDHCPPDDGATALVHGDYRLDNMVFSHDRLEIIGILDWELSTLGHPLSDLAYQCMQWRLPNEGAFRGLGGIDRKALGIPSEAAYVARYCERRGLSPIADWRFVLAFSFFRLAAILQGVHRRFIDGNASNPEKAELYGRMVPVLAEMAVAMIEEGHEDASRQG